MQIASAELLIRDCPSCSSASHARLASYSLDQWNVVECGDCSFVYLRNTPAYEELVDNFAWEKTFEAEAKRRKKRSPILSYLDAKTRWRLHIFRPDEARELQAMFGSGKVLDVGCGGGTTVPDPFIPHGIEISRGLHEQADRAMRARGGHAVHAPAVEGAAQFPDSFFDGVVLRSFLEHEANPKPLLQQIRRVLAPKGVVYVKVPNYGSVNRRVMGGKWCGFRYPDHVNYFTLASLKRMARDCGFRFKLRNPLNLAFDDNIHAELRCA